MILGGDVPWGVASADKSSLVVGKGSLSSSTTGQDNYIFGRDIAPGLSLGGSNAIYGGTSFNNLTGSSSNNVHFGVSGFVNATTTFFNTGLGGNIGNSITTGDGNTLMGYGADPGSNVSDNVIINSGTAQRARFDGTEWDFNQRFKEIKFNNVYIAGSTDNALPFYNKMVDGTVLGYTPTVYGSTTAGVGTYNTQDSKIGVIGNLLILNIRLNWGAHTGTGNMYVSLPFSLIEFMQASIWVNSLDSLSASNVAQVRINSGNSFARIDQYPVGGGFVSSVAMDTSVQIRLTIIGTWIA
jgi:hypothetical protein